MKYNTIIVPVMFAALTAAAATEHKSDQGTYRPQQSQFKGPLSNQKSQDRSRRPGEQGAVPPAPVRNAASEAPKPGTGAPFEAKDRAEDVRAANSPADPRPVDMVSDAQPGEVPYQAKDQADAARHDGVQPSQAIRKAEGVHPVDITVEAPRPAGEQRLPPQPPRLRRFSRSHAARAEMSESCGIMRVETASSAYSGFVAEQRDENGRYIVDAEKSNAVLTKIKAHNIIPSNGDGYDVLGATFGVMYDDAGDEQLRGNSANFAMLTGTSKTLYGKGPSNGRSSFNDAVGAHQRIESAVYTLTENGEILPSWVNKDGVSTPATWGVTEQKQLIYSANVGQYIAEYGGMYAKVFCLF